MIHSKTLDMSDIDLEPGNRYVTMTAVSLIASAVFDLELLGGTMLTHNPLSEDVAEHVREAEDGKKGAR